jgi:hypothetical protein
LTDSKRDILEELRDFIYDSIEGFLTGFFVAGLIGYVIGILTDAIFEALTTIYPLIAILAIAYSIYTFYAGTEEAYGKGFFFSLGIIAIAWLLKDFVTILSGCISILGLFIGAIQNHSN